jgi:DNA-binding IclR family transcriptional regulator
MNTKVPALEKGLKIIEFMLTASEPITMSQIAERLGYKVSEVQRTVTYLSAEQYLIRNGAGSYMPGPKIYQFADQNRETILINRAEGPMRAYAEKTAASVHLSVLVEEMLHIIFEIESKEIVRISIRPGLYEAVSTASGRLLLAYAQSPILAATERQKIMELGYAFKDIDCVQGVYALAVPICTQSGLCIAALASPYVLPRGAKEAFRQELVEPLKRAANDIASLL